MARTFVLFIRIIKCIKYNSFPLPLPASIYGILAFFNFIINWNSVTMEGLYSSNISTLVIPNSPWWYSSTSLESRLRFLAFSNPHYLPLFFCLIIIKPCYTFFRSNKNWIKVWFRLYIENFVVFIFTNFMYNPKMTIVNKLLIPFFSIINIFWLPK